MSSSDIAGLKGKPEGKAEAKKSKNKKGKKPNKGGNAESDSTKDVNTDNANTEPTQQEDESKPDGTDNQAKPDKNGDATDNTEKPKAGTAGKQGKSKAQNGMEVATALFGLDKFKAKPEKKDFKFWKDQPVLKMDQKADDHGPIESKKLDEVKKDPYNLPTGFAWETIDMSDEKATDEVYNLLTNHYVEDDDAQFRFDYSKPFLSWALKPPGYIKDWHVGVREIAGKKRLLGFITGIPVDIRAHDKPLKVAEINFLCVHKALRSKRLAPVLIMEITRRVNLTGIWQAVYTAGVVIPKPVARNRYWHRSLNPKKLIEIGFSRLAPKMTMTMTIKLYQLPNAPVTKGIRPMEKKDVPQAMALLNKYLSKFKLVQEFHEEEFAHWFLPRPGIMNAYVVEGADHKITDMCSFYTLNSSVIKNPKHPTLNAAYSFYNVSTKTPMQELMTDALVLAKQAGYDVFNALDVMENEKFFKPLKFGIGDGHLQYYLYNWRCPDMTADQVGLVLM